MTECSVLAAAVEWAMRPDGFIHLVQEGHDLPRGPLGVLCYLPFVPVYWFLPIRARASFLTGSSLLLALLTLGPGYALTVLGFACAAWGAAHAFARAGRAAIGVSLLSVLYFGLVLYPQPAWLPRVERPLYFYLHWAGLGYMYLKSLHVLIDIAKARMLRPGAGDYFAWLLFAPTLRMGPILRFGEFETQLKDDPRRYRDLGAAAIRIVVGLVRVGLMAVLLGTVPLDDVFAASGELSPLRLLQGIYIAPLSIYLWISGYVDLSVGVGLALGFRVPENFCYPWKSTSLAEFWRRWHITLGAWLRDYLYFPLGGSRRHVYRNYLATFLFCGLWHGVYLSYALWGLSQGFGLAVGRQWNQYWTKHREQMTPLYARLRRWRLVASPLNAALAWLLTFHYQILTIAWFMDERYAGLQLARRAASVFWGS